jgi:signal transduction histidine kinase
MPTNVREIYLQVVRTLPPTEQLHLANLILNDLSQENVSVVEQSDTSTQKDCLDVTTRSIQIEEVLARVNTDRGLENIQQQLCQEICDRQQAEINLQQTLKTLLPIQIQLIQNAKNYLGDLVAGIGHDINNPIGVLRGNINYVKEYFQDLIGHLALYQQHYPNPAATIQENAEDIDLEYLIEDFLKLLNSMPIAIDRIMNLIAPIRNFCRPDSDFKVFCNIHNCIDTPILILKKHHFKANQHRPEIEIIKNYGDLPKIECFPAQLNQVFMTILVNAIDMFDKMAQTWSSAEIQAHPQQIFIHTEIISDQVKISIRDNGLGMSEDVKSKIFDYLFFTPKTVGKCAGLGLTIARQIVVKNHGGAIEVNSTLGQGTEFIILLPVCGS